MNKKKILVGGALFFLCLCFTFSFDDEGAHWLWAGQLIFPVVFSITSLALFIAALFSPEKTV